MFWTCRVNMTWQHDHTLNMVYFQFKQLKNQCALAGDDLPALWARRRHLELLLETNGYGFGQGKENKGEIKTIFWNLTIWTTQPWNDDKEPYTYHGTHYMSPITLLLGPWSSPWQVKQGMPWASMELKQFMLPWSAHRSAELQVKSQFRHCPNMTLEFPAILWRGCCNHELQRGCWKWLGCQACCVALIQENLHSVNIKYVRKGVPKWIDPMPSRSFQGYLMFWGRDYTRCAVAALKPSQVLRKPLLKRCSYGFCTWRCAVVRQVTCPNMLAYIYIHTF